MKKRSLVVTDSRSLYLGCIRKVKAWLKMAKSIVNKKLKVWYVSEPENRMDETVCTE